MCVVSDFLDRVASRVIGGEPMLAPRVPSLFEPVQRDAVMQVVTESREAGPETSADAGDSQRADRATNRVRRDAMELRHPDRGVHAFEQSAALHVDPVRPVVMKGEVEGELVTAAAMASVQSPVVREAAERSVRHEHVHHHVVLSQGDGERGALLPPRGAVFPEPAPSVQRNDRQASRQPVQREHETPGLEPVVHVSIGRLEVRAATSHAPASRRQDAPQRSAFDDYLRERGKAAP